PSANNGSCNPNSSYLRLAPSTGTRYGPVSARPRRSPPAVARSSWPAPTAKPRRPSPAPSVAPARPFATRSTPSPGRGSTACERSPPARTPPSRCWTAPGPSRSRRSCTSGHGRSASRPVSGRWTWWPRSATPRGGRPGSWPARPSARRSSGWASDGGGRSGGSPAPTGRTRVKKSPRPVDPTGGDAPQVGGGLPGRDVVESADAPEPARLGAAERPTAPGRAGGTQGRPGPQGAVVLRAVAGGHRRAVAAVGEGPAGRPVEGGLPGLGVPGFEGRGEAGFVADRGQPLRARQSGGAGVDKDPQPPGQGGRGRAGRGLLPAGEEPVAQPDRAEVGEREEGDRRAGPPAHRVGGTRTGPGLLRL